MTDDESVMIDIIENPDGTYSTSNRCDEWI